MSGVTVGCFHSAKAFICLAAIATVLQIGCGENGPAAPKTYLVSGTVTLDGKPLADGAIVLDPEDGQSIAAQGAIKDGTFSFESPVGPKIVRISASKVTGEKDQYDQPVSVPLVADEFNTQSTLKTEVKAVENKDLKFEVKSPPPAAN